MRRSTRLLCNAVIAAGLAWSSVASAQKAPLSERESPVALNSTGHGQHDSDVLRRRVSFRVSGIELGAALDKLSKDSKVPIVYSRSLLPASHRVSVDATNETVEDILAMVLQGTDLGILASRGGKVMIAQRSTATTRDAKAQDKTGTVTGTVIDSTTGRGVKGAAVAIAGTSFRGLTDDEGAFSLAGIPVGERILMVKSLGFRSVQRNLVISESTPLRIRIALAPAAIALSEVVTTATGEQRIKELGHVVTKINVDSLVKNAPVMNLGELLTARVPGLQVAAGSGGSAGGSMALRLRGTTTTVLDAQPIVIVDGVRFRNSDAISQTGGATNTVFEDGRPFGAEQRSPLHDLNVKNIETIEIVKGPSASTLYGPDAANGVIIITTKKPKAGTPVWGMYVYPRLNTRIENNGRGNAPSHGYWGWGHDPVTGDRVEFSCDLQRIASGSCVQDSVTQVPFVTSIPSLNVIAKQRPAWLYGTNVTGGSDALRYYFSLGGEWQVGSVRIPPAIAERFKQERGIDIARDATRNPNTQRMLSSQANVTVNPDARTTLTLASTYTQSQQRSVDMSVFGGTLSSGSVGGDVISPGCAGRTIDDPCYRDLVNAYESSYGSAYPFLASSQRTGRRLVLSATGSRQIWPWLTANGTIGTDLDWSVDRAGIPQGTITDNDGGGLQERRRDHTGRSVRSGLTATHRTGRVSFRTAVGAEYLYKHLDGLNAAGYGLAPGSSSMATAGRKDVSQTWTERVDLGGYIEEVVGLNERMFVTGGMRVDGSTTFGDAYRPRPVPKLSFSWIASEEPWFPTIPFVSSVRVRSAIGSAGKYPVSAMKLGNLYSQNEQVEGRTQTIFDREDFKGVRLRPERTREFEYGAEMDLFTGRVSFDVTAYRRRTTDQLVKRPPEVGLLAQWVNGATFISSGREISMTASLFRTPRTELSFLVNYAYNASNVIRPSAFEGMKEGYPIGALFVTPIIDIKDTVGGAPDGIVTYQEVVLDSVARYMGVGFPPHTYTVNPSLSVLGGWIRLSSSFDMSRGFVVQSGEWGTSSDPGTFYRETPLLQQAYAVTRGMTKYDRGDFIRWREFSMVTQIPQRILRLLRFSRGSVNVSVRDLALWTQYRGADPERIPGAGLVGNQGVGVGRGTPAPRSWSVSFDVSR